MDIKYGFLQTKVTTEEEKCRAANCFRVIKHDQTCFIDVERNRILCEGCGKCERYERKKLEEMKAKGINEIPLIKGLDY